MYIFYFRCFFLRKYIRDLDNRSKPWFSLHSDWVNFDFLHGANFSWLELILTLKLLHKDINIVFSKGNIFALSGAK